jgi:hypothetical protein
MLTENVAYTSWNPAVNHVHYFVPRPSSHGGCHAKPSYSLSYFQQISFNFAFFNGPYDVSLFHAQVIAVAGLVSLWANR